MVDRNGNLIPATGFMPAAERYNLMTSIERWVVGSLVEYLHRQWTAGAIPHEPSSDGERGFYSVNISGASVNDKSFPISSQLARAPLPRPAVFRITETTAIWNFRRRRTDALAKAMVPLRARRLRHRMSSFAVPQ